MSLSILILYYRKLKHECVCMYVLAYLITKVSVSHREGEGHVSLPDWVWSRKVACGPCLGPTCLAASPKAGIQCTKSMLAKGIEMEWKSTPENVSNFFHMSPISWMLAYFSVFHQIPFIVTSPNMKWLRIEFLKVNSLYPFF